MHFRWRLVLGAVLALISAQGAQAAFSLTLSGGDSPLVVNDRYTGSSTPDPNDGSNLKGTISFSDYYAGLLINAVSGTSNLPGLPSATVTTSNLQITNNTGEAKTITVLFKEDAFSAPSSPGLPAFLSGKMSNFVASGGVSVSYYAQVVENGGGSAFTSNTVTSTGDDTTDKFTNVVTFNRATDTYQLLSVATITLQDGASVTFNTQSVVNAAPAPAGLVLAATAVPFVGLLRRRLKKAVPVA